MGAFPEALPGQSPDHTVRDMIQYLRKDLASLLRGESTAYATFIDACDKFDAFAHSHFDVLSDDALDLILDFSAPLSTISSSMIQLENQKAALFEQFPEDIMNVLSEKTSQLQVADPGYELQSNYPLYVEPCARWLKDNCHNPYPSSDIRSQIARQTLTERKDIDAWFIDARKRIGWNDLRRKHFDNKKALILQAASIFFNAQLSPPDSDALEPHIECEFAAILASATALYEQKFSRSKLADTLDVAVKDITPVIKKQLKNEKIRQREQGMDSRINNKRARHPYPTPERSPASVAELLASPPSSVIDLTFGENSPTLGRKRRRSLQSDDEATSNQRSKKPRSKPNHREINPEKALPSPAGSIQEELSEPSPVLSPQTLSHPQSNPPDASTCVGKRKRRLSDGFQYPATKRPQIRPQAVSDPFPPANSEDWDQWFRQHVLSSPELILTGDVPPPVTVEAPDSDTPLDIQLFNFPLIPDLPPSVPAAPAPVAELNVVETFEVPPGTQDNVDPATTTLDPTFSWMPNDFPPPLQPASTFPSSTDLYVSSAPFPTLDVITQPFANTQSSAFLPDPSLWSNIPVTELDFAALFNQPSTGTAVTASIQVPSQPNSSTIKALSEQEREAKRRELEELEARAQAIRAEISAP
uniref:Mating-type protein beta 1 n=1 Tax=Coprinopsis cinerea TaxID=5346 RepID=Q9Y712_COPCI|nr:mating-type protein beta 1 [Coprinopsis cinerea]AAD33327.1 mating-type protein beta 1 [Coprinopsis cinerea]AAD33328.1 mating-type protein beta 1 [Coprinopsis cinerea]AAD33329.1 mating-type protein beta 1 [Coprinopsis cinerea]